MSFHQIKIEYERRDILQLLVKASGYSLNSAIIRAGLVDFGHTIGRDVLEIHLAWLQDAGLISLQSVGDDAMLIASITGRGEDVATGAANVPGIRKPGPENDS